MKTQYPKSVYPIALSAFSSWTIIKSVSSLQTHMIVKQFPWCVISIWGWLLRLLVIQCLWRGAWLLACIPPGYRLSLTLYSPCALKQLQYIHTYIPLEGWLEYHSHVRLICQGIINNEEINTHTKEKKKKKFCIKEGEDSEKKTLNADTKPMETDCMKTTDYVWLETHWLATLES